jgi:FkbM family methyltransferase
MIDDLKNALRRVGAMQRTYNRLRGFRVHEPRRRPSSSARYLGSSYGGWMLEADGLDENSIAYCAGVGEDIDFDIALIDLIGCQVYAFDPTPIAVRWIEAKATPPQFSFFPVGFAAEDGEVEFQVPPIDGYHSFSLTVAADAAITGTIKCRVATIPSLMEEYGHTQIDLLKMDIEGFEYSVLDHLLDYSKVRPKHLLLEFHHKMYAHTIIQTKRAVARLQSSGYELYWVSNNGHEYSFRLIREAVQPIQQIGFEV